MAYQFYLADSGNLDAFTRLRISNPFTQFDSKQLFDNLPLFWDDSEVSGGGTTSTHSVDRASSVLAVAGTTAGKRVRQTKMRFNYQPGKSMLIFMTGNLSDAGAGVNAKVGYFDDNNGIYFENDGGTLKVGIRSNVTGSAVDNAVAQSAWNIDKLDGLGKSNKTIDPEKVQIMVVDFEWLGVGRVRCGFVIGGVVYYVHQFNNANETSSVYMSTPNLPLRAEIENDGTGEAASLQQICATVISEGGLNENGALRYVSNGNTFVNANSVGTIYAVMGIRLKSTHLGASIKIVNASAYCSTNDDYEWMMLLNPTLASAMTFTAETDSCVETGVGESSSPSLTTMTGGYKIGGGYVKSGSDTGSFQQEVSNAILLGSQIDGTRDEIYLGIRPLAANATVAGGLTWRELT